MEYNKSYDNLVFEDIKDKITEAISNKMQSDNWKIKEDCSVVPGIVFIPLGNKVTESLEGIIKCVPAIMLLGHTTGMIYHLSLIYLLEY